MQGQPEENKTTVRRFIEQCWNKADLDAIPEYIAPDCHTRSGATVGPEVWKQEILRWRTGFPDFAYHLHQLTAEDDVVVANATFTGTHLGVLQNIPKAFGSIEPTGKHVDTREVLTFRLAGGKVGAIASVWEELEFLQQLGVFPALTQATS